MASLIDYDGSAGVLVDTNVWVDSMDDGSDWHDWAIDQLQACSERAPLHVNVVIYAELLVPRSDSAAIDDLLDVFETQRSPLPWEAAPLAAAAYQLYRARGGTRARPLPDFLIGAHAAVANLGILTRDRTGYATCFPRLRLVAPEPTDR